MKKEYGKWDDEYDNDAMTTTIIMWGFPVFVTFKLDIRDTLPDWPEEPELSMSR